MARFRRSDPSSNEFFRGQHRFEHWYRDNSIYFITARCRDKYPAFQREEAKAIFWDRFEHYTKLHTFTPLVTTLMDNHYHTEGYLKVGAELGEMMRKLRGSVAKLVNDIVPERRLPFWRDDDHNDYFDGCLRDVLQYRRTYKYVRDQAVRAGIVKDYRDYPHTRINVELEVGLKRAVELKAFMEGIPYQRYERWRKRKGRDQ
jgi:hypothetical protein